MSELRYTPCKPIALPTDWWENLDGYQWERNLVGESACAVYRLSEKAGAADVFLKHGTGAVTDELAGEWIRLRWMAERLPVSRPLMFACNADEAWLLSGALPGQTVRQELIDRPGNRTQMVELLATFLRQIHAVGVGECPFINDHSIKLAEARRRVDAGLVDEHDFDDTQAGWSARQVLGAAEALLPMVPDPIFSHGDYSLDNILVHDGAIAGCIDVGGAGIADRYQDIAIAWNDLAEFGVDLQNSFLRLYGIAQADHRKLRFHILLNELF